MELDRLQATYAAALRRVMADLTSTTNLRPAVVVDFTDPDGAQYRFWGEGGGEYGRDLGWVDDEESAAVRLADRVQEDALEELWGPPWPTCPGHTHPALATLQEGRGTWVCPRSHRRLAVIGSLSP
jgi:hypothetical protein